MRALALPDIAHVPGSGTKPERATLEAAKALVRGPVIANEWQANEPYRYGSALYVNGFFWEAHEVWEAVWKACAPNSAERRLMQGVIQLANAALKLKMKRDKAALRLLEEAQAHLGEAALAAPSEVMMGVPLDRLRAAARDLLKRIERGYPAELEVILAPLRPVARSLDS